MLQTISQVCEGKNVGMADNKLSRNAVNHWARRRISENMKKLRSDIRTHFTLLLSASSFTLAEYLLRGSDALCLNWAQGLKVSLNSLYVTRQPSNEGVVYRCVSACLPNVSTLDLLTEAWLVLSVWSEQCVNVGEKCLLLLFWLARGPGRCEGQREKGRKNKTTW